MNDSPPGAVAPPPVTLYARDLELVLKLIPRAQIVVGDIPQIYPTLQRLELAVSSARDYAPVVAPDVSPEA